MRYLVWLGFAVIGFGQEARPTFDVASIKPHAVRTDVRGVTSRNGVLSVKNVSLRQLIGFLYRVEEFQVLGGPDWIADEGWDIEAKSPGDTSEDDAKLPAEERNALNTRLVRRTENLLADRFGLVVRRETRQGTYYQLQVERNGHKLEQAKDGAAPQFSRRGNGGRIAITGAGLPLTTLAIQLSRIIGVPVVNQTELSGNFNFKIEWAPEGASDTGGASIFTAVKEQLGLRLGAVKGPVDVLVVERVERPSEN